MVKKKKSVERTKADKIKNNNENNNKNSNTQITQIIFPPNMELRTKKKKRKGKSKAQKKKEEEKEELLEMLKSKLEEYDKIQELAQEKKIAIPNQLALSVINTEDLKTNEDIENYINDITQKINALTELINKPINIFSVGRPARQGLGVIQPSLPTLPPLINPTQPDRQTPAIAPVAPPRAVEPKVPDSQSPVINPTQEELEKIKKELEGEVGEKNLPLKKETIEKGDLVNIQIKEGDRFINIQTPKGFEDLFNLYKKYIEDVEFITSQNQRLKGIYHIPIDKYTQLIIDRNSLNDKYNKWFNELPNRLKYYVDKTNPTLSKFNKEINTNTKLEPKELVKSLFRNQDIEFTEITQGNEQPAVVKAIRERGFKDEKQEKIMKDFDKYIINTNKELVKIDTKISKSAGNKVKLDMIGDEINLLQSQIDSKFNSLPKEVAETERNTIEQIRVKLNELRTMNSTARDIVITKPNKFQLTPAQNISKQNMEKNFIRSKKSKNLTPTLKENIRLFFGEDKGNKIINELGKFGNTTKKIKEKKEKLRDYIAEYETGGVDAVNVI